MTIVAARAGTPFKNLRCRSRSRSIGTSLDDRRQALTRSLSVRSFLYAACLNCGVSLFECQLPLGQVVKGEKHGKPFLCEELVRGQNPKGAVFERPIGRGTIGKHLAMTGAWSPCRIGSVGHSRSDRG
jgi:hypothetical protein